MLSRRFKFASFELTMLSLSQARRLGGLHRRVGAKRVSLRTFPHSPLRTGRATFIASGSPRVDFPPSGLLLNLSLQHLRSLHFRSHGPFTALLLLIDFATVNPLPSFALWLAFPTSDYYDGSDASISHRWAAHLNILVEVSHVHIDGLNRIV
jgi:hypothetical protein